MIVRMAKATSKGTKAHPLNPSPISRISAVLPRSRCKHWGRQISSAQRVVISKMEDTYRHGENTRADVRKRKTRRMTVSGE